MTFDEWRAMRDRRPWNPAPTSDDIDILLAEIDRLDALALILVRIVANFPIPDPVPEDET